MWFLQGFAELEAIHQSSQSILEWSVQYKYLLNHEYYNRARSNKTLFISQASELTQDLKEMHRLLHVFHGFPRVTLCERHREKRYSGKMDDLASLRWKRVDYQHRKHSMTELQDKGTAFFIELRRKRFLFRRTAGKRIHGWIHRNGKDRMYHKIVRCR